MNAKAFSQSDSCRVVRPVRRIDKAKGVELGCSVPLTFSLPLARTRSWMHGSFLGDGKSFALIDPFASPCTLRKRTTKSQQSWSRRRTGKERKWKPILIFIIIVHQYI